VCYFCWWFGREFLKARIIPQRIEHRIDPEQRRSERPGIESSFCRAAMARSGSPIPAATRASGSREFIQNSAWKTALRRAISHRNWATHNTKSKPVT